MASRRAASRAPTHPQHLVRTIAVLVVVTLISTVGLGFVQANDGSSGAREMPSSFRLPQPRVGDAGTYQWSKGASLGGDPVNVTRFDWLDPDNVRNRTGTLRQTNRLHHTAYVRPWSPPEADNENDTGSFEDHRRTSIKHFDPGTDRFLGEDAVWWRRTQYDQEVLATRERDTHINYTRTIYDDGFGLPDQGLCGLRHPLQGSSIQTNDTVIRWTDCRIYRAPGPAPSGGYHGSVRAEPVVIRSVNLTVERMGAVGDRRAFVLESDRVKALDGRLRVWMSPSVPYPLQIAVVSGPDRTSSVARLTAFESGSSPLVDTGQIEEAAEPAPELVWDDKRIWGPSEARIDHPFPLSEAFARARDNPGNDDLRAFLDQHPEAHVVSASYLVWQEGDDITRSWSFTVSDDSEGMDLVVYEHIRDPTVYTEETWPGQASRLRHHDYQYGEVEPSEGSPPKSAVPRMPTTGSMLDRWAAFARPSLDRSEGNVWSFLLTCGDESCEDVRFYLRAGALQVGHRSGEIPLAEGEDRWNISHIWMDRDGVVRTRTEGGALMTERVGPADGGSDDPPSSPSVASAEIPGSAWTFPGPARTPAAGLLGLLAAVAYWTWPAVKNGGLSLFSRVGEDDALDHPTRRELVELIRREPGIHLQAIRRRTELANGTVRHHLRMLVETGHLARREADGYACYFPAGIDTELRDALVRVRSEGARAILEALAATPGASATEIADAIEIAPASVHYHLERLQEAGVVEVMRDGQSLSLELTALGREAHDKLGGAR